MNKFFAVAFACYAMCGIAEAAAGLTWKTEPSIPDSVEKQACEPSGSSTCPDLVVHSGVSRVGPKVTTTFHEGTRVEIGFGNASAGGATFLADQIHPGGYDWGGQIKDGKFTPLYVIKRFYGVTADGSAVDKSHTELVIFRLLENGKSCIAKTLRSSSRANAIARRAAEKDLEKPACLQ